MTQPFRVLAVCTGNVCRSPATELLLAQGLFGSALEISSAGTQGLVGQPITDAMRERLRRRGLDPDRHRARRLERSMLQKADLVLALSRENRAETVRMLPSALRKTFTLREFARILAELAHENRLQSQTTRTLDSALVGAVAASRVMYRSDNPEDDDVDDPYLQSSRIYERSITQIDTATSTMVKILG